MLGRIFLREIKLAFRQTGGALAGLAFFLMAYALFAFTMTPEGLNQYTEAVLTVILLLSVIISLPYLWEKDVTDGSMEAYLLLPIMAEAVTFIKIAAYWIGYTVPLLVLSFIIYIATQPELSTMFTIKLVSGSISLVAIGALGAALTLFSGKDTLARAIILLPLYIPILIFMVIDKDQLYPLYLLFAWAPLQMLISTYVCAILVRYAVE